VSESARFKKKKKKIAKLLSHAIDKSYIAESAPANGRPASG
jgi:hypothetical protein